MTSETGMQSLNTPTDANCSVSDSVYHTVNYGMVKAIAHYRNNVPAAKTEPVKETRHVESFTQEVVQHSSGLVLEDEARTVWSLGLRRRPIIE